MHFHLTAFCFDQGECRSFAGLSGANPIHRLDQFVQLRCRVVTGDVAGGMTQQHLARLQRHAGGSQAPAERVLEIVHPDVFYIPPADVTSMCMTTQTPAA